MKKKLITVMLIVAMSTVSAACGAGTGDEEAAVSGSENEVVAESDESEEVIVGDGDSSSESSDEISLGRASENIKNATVVEEIYNSFGYPETSVEDSSVDKDYIITTTYLDFENNHYSSQQESGKFMNGSPYEPDTSETEDIIDDYYAWGFGHLYDVLDYNWEVVNETDDSIFLTYNDELKDLELINLIALNDDLVITNRTVTATFNKELNCWNHIEVELEYGKESDVEETGPQHIYRYELTMTDINNTSVE